MNKITTIEHMQKLAIASKNYMDKRIEGLSKNDILLIQSRLDELQQKIGGAVIEDEENETSYLARLKLYGGEPYLEYTEL